MVMDLHEIFLFLMYYDEKLPHMCLLWLNNFSLLEQGSFVCLITNCKNYKLKSKLKFTSTTPIQHNNDCLCKHYYNIVSDFVHFPYELIGKCLNQMQITKTQQNNVPQSNFFENVVSALDFDNLPQVSNQKKIVNDRFKKFPSYIHTPNKLSIYNLLTLLKNEQFDFNALAVYLDVIEIAAIFMLIKVTIFKCDFFEKFLPSYKRSLRYVENISNNRDILTEIYQHFNNKNLNVKLTSPEYTGLSLRRIKLINAFYKNADVIQLGYVGERFVLHVTKNQLHIFNDFGEHLGIYSRRIEFPFENEDIDCVLECIHTRNNCYIVDLYVYAGVVFYSSPIELRMNVLSKITLKNNTPFEIASIISLVDLPKYCDISSHVLDCGYNQLLYDSIIFRTDDLILKYKLTKRQIKFNTNGLVTMTPYNFSFQSKYSAYFVLRGINNECIINAWDKNHFIPVGKIKVPKTFFDCQKTTNVTVKIDFNSFIENHINEIVSILRKKYKSVYNCVSIEELLKIK